MDTLVRKNPMAEIEPAGKARKAAALSKASTEVDVLFLRTKGYSFAQIAEEEKISASRATKIVRDALREYAKEHQLLTSELRIIMYERLELIFDKLMPGIEKGDVRAIDRALTTINAISRLMGLEAKAKVEVSHIEAVWEHVPKIPQSDLDE